MSDHTTRPSSNEIPYGYCLYGCGQKTSIAPKSNKRQGRVKGQPMRYLPGHNKAPAHLSMAERLYARCDMPAADSCWLWQGTVRAGYGEMRFRRNKYATHRLAYELHHGPIPDGMWVLHKCDVKLCCNPAHLFLGSPKDNVDDMVAKERQVRGENQHSAKLTESDVIEIRRLYGNGMTCKAIATRYEIDPSTAHSAAVRKNWKHVT